MREGIWTLVNPLSQLETVVEPMGENDHAAQLSGYCLLTLLAVLGQRDDMGDQLGEAFRCLSTHSSHSASDGFLISTGQVGTAYRHAGEEESGIWAVGSDLRELILDQGSLHPLRLDHRNECFSRCMVLWEVGGGGDNVRQFFKGQLSRGAIC